MVTGNIIRLLGYVVVQIVAIYLILHGQWMLGGGLHLVAVGWLLVGTLNPQSGWFGPIQTKTGSEEIWLTFDDGPDPEDTPVLLRLLKEHGVKATFFVIGEKAAKYPRLIEQMHADGHQIGNHTWSHPQRTFWCAGPWRTYREIVKCQGIVEEIIGEGPKVFRAPVGHHNLFVHAVLRRFGLKLIGWSSRGFDGVSQDAEEVIGRIKRSMKPGGIVLAHEDSAIALEVVSAILEYAQENGWSFKNPS